MPATPNASLDAIVVGAGLNGLAAAVALAQQGRSVRVYEAQSVAGGSVRSEALTEPGFTHDLGAAVHSLVLASPFLRSLPLEQHGLQLVHPEVAFAHPLDDGTAVTVERSVSATAERLGTHDARAYNKLITPLVHNADDLMSALLGPLGHSHPLLMARFGMHAIQSAAGLANRTFESERSRALLAGLAAHSMVPLHELGTSGYALGLLIGAHAYGWPVARGGSQQLATAMVSLLQSLGGDIITNSPVQSLAELPPSRTVLCDVTPRQFLRITGDRLPSFYRGRLERFRYGPGVFKMDWALNAPVPWTARACANAGTVHIGGSLAEIANSEQEVAQGRIPEDPYVLVVQPSVADPSRAPAGRHTLWAYCHVPNGSTVDMQHRIELQIERFAPGFRDCISTRHVLTPALLEQWNANLIGGDIAGGAGNLDQIVGRPVLSFHPYSTPLQGVYLCSSSTPPGIGVHGMCGFHAAQSALEYLRRS